MASKPCLSCVERGSRAKHDKGCRDDSAYRNRSIQWVKTMMRLLAKEPKSMRGFTFMPKGEVT